MFTRVLAKRIVNWLVNGGGKEEKRSVYEFGLDKLIQVLINFFAVMSLGFIIGIPLEAIAFYLTYSILRVYAGGYHAENPVACFFVSIGILIPCLIAIQHYHMWNILIVNYGLLAVSVATLVIIGPVEHKNKRLDALERVVYCRRMLRNLIISVIGVIVLMMVEYHSFAMAMLCGVILTTVTAVVGNMVLKRDPV